MSQSYEARFAEIKAEILNDQKSDIVERTKQIEAGKKELEKHRNALKLVKKNLEQLKRPSEREKLETKNQQIIALGQYMSRLYYCQSASFRSDAKKQLFELFDLDMERNLVKLILIAFDQIQDKLDLDMLAESETKLAQLMTAEKADQPTPPAPASPGGEVDRPPTTPTATDPPSLPAGMKYAANKADPPPNPPLVAR